MIKALKVFPVIGCVISGYFLITSPMLFGTESVTLGQALLRMFTFAIVLYISYQAYIEIITLEKRLGSRKTKGTQKNILNSCIPVSANYASSFRLDEPVVTTEEYYEGSGYHAYIEDIDRTDAGRPFKIRMCGNLGSDWVSFDEIAPDKELEKMQA